jgi:hypothetical protein
MLLDVVSAVVSSVERRSERRSEPMLLSWCECWP